jgi:hypothetical protein
MATNEELKSVYNREVGKNCLGWLRIAILTAFLQIGDSIWVDLKLKHKCIVLILQDRGAL